MNLTPNVSSAKKKCAHQASKEHEHHWPTNALPTDLCSFITKINFTVEIFFPMRKYYRLQNTNSPLKS